VDEEIFVSFVSAIRESATAPTNLHVPAAVVDLGDHRRP
jgi:hypothetical protein